jgi:D-aminoacyl-tRNA deacylase
MPMRVVVQRVSEAAVTVGGQIVGQIGRGLLIFVGIEERDGAEDIEWIVGKVTRLRIFADEAGVMNRSLLEAGGEVLVISQFTLLASTRKGNRPSYSAASRPEHALSIYEQLLARLARETSREVPSGKFGADMQVSLCNEGPVTILLDSQRRE